MAEDLPPWCGELELLLTYTLSLFNTNLVKRSLGDPCGGGTPGYIPNPVVKPASADGTAPVAGWESRSLPRDFFLIPLIPPIGTIKFSHKDAEKHL